MGVKKGSFYIRSDREETGNVAFEWIRGHGKEVPGGSCLEQRI